MDTIYIQGVAYEQNGPLIPTPDLTIQIIEFTFTHDGFLEVWRFVKKRRRHVFVSNQSNNATTFECPSQGVMSLGTRLSVHGAMVLSWWLPCWILASMSVRCLVFTYDFIRLVSWWAMTLCLMILRPLRNLLLHRESKCGQVSAPLIWHNV